MFVRFPNYTRRMWGWEEAVTRGVLRTEGGGLSDTMTQRTVVTRNP